MTKLIPLSRAVAQVAAVTGACLLAFACPAAAYSPALKGGENQPLSLTSTTSTQASSTGGASLTRTVVGLAIVLAVIWGLWWVLRQVKNGREPSVAGASGLASVAALTLASGRSVHLIRVGSDYVLLGVAEQGLVPIHRYTEEQARAAGLPELAQAGSAPRQRRTLLAGMVTGTATGTGTRTGTGTGSAAGATNVVGPSEVVRPDPMRMGTPTVSVVERLRELTVRR